ncbi:putative Diguanylate cyclase [Candidatus Sulfobium mesophilum]|uniref:diguanylate cyclase n=1 Tax=Candidatus Sulfobium mesophilum TaxID=2016548 RepID=A0A2U3QIQ9_9BACT|nr:putative Diguanylate cyclase [Candidatus Sulfobium mesophilum]
MGYLLISAALLIVVIVTVVAYRKGEARGLHDNDTEENKKNKALLKEISSKGQLVLDLQAQIDALNDLNGRYLTFMFTIPSIVKRLNASQHFDEVISSISRLIKDVISTDTVEIYTLDRENDILQKVSSEGEAPEAQCTYALGEGLVGAAAKDGMLRTKDTIPKGRIIQNNTGQDKSDIWMAAPINFDDSLIGVIGIGKAKKRTGNEGNFMKMIADVAGVVLMNQALLGDTKHKAETDPLTGLYNRRYFFQMAQNAVEKSIMDHSPISIFLFDIDHFKNYNDTNGHDAGDRLLKELSSVTLKVTRKTSVVARYGGEEFIVLLPGLGKEDAFTYAERLRETICSHPFPNGDMQPLECVSISGGIASFPADGGSIKELVSLADTALYQAKSEGRNRVAKHKPFFFSEAEVVK